MSREDTDTVAAISRRYERQLAAKDAAIAALCRRVGTAEQARDRYRAALAALAAGAAQEPPAALRAGAHGETTRAPTVALHLPRQLLRGRGGRAPPTS